ASLQGSRRAPAWSPCANPRAPSRPARSLKPYCFSAKRHRCWSRQHRSPPHRTLLPQPPLIIFLRILEVNMVQIFLGLHLLIGLFRCPAATVTGVPREQNCANLDARPRAYPAAGVFRPGINPPVAAAG